MDIRDAIMFLIREASEAKTPAKRKAYARVAMLLVEEYCG